MSRSRASTGPAGGEQPVLARGRGQLGESRAEDEAALHVAGDQTVVLEGDGEPVRGGPGQPVPATRPARVAGPDSRAESTRAALSSTPTPLELSIL